MTLEAASATRTELLDNARAGLSELFGAERRVRAREHQNAGELTLSQLRALLVLRRSEEVTAGDLARSADLNPASVTAMLDQLEASGIVERRRCRDDRRRCLVSLTERGQAVVDERLARWHAHWNEGLAGVSDDELATAVRFLGAVADLLDAL